MKNFFLIAFMFIGFYCNAQSTSLDLILQRDIELPEELGYISYIKDAGNDKIIIVTFQDQQWSPWIYDTKKDTIYSIGINDNPLSTNVNGFYSYTFGSTVVAPYQPESDLDVFVVRDGKIYYTAIQQDPSLPLGYYLFESNGLPNGTKMITKIPNLLFCDASYGLLYNTPEKLFFLAEPYDCQRDPFRIYSFETDTFIEKTTIPFNFENINYIRYFQKDGHFFIGFNDNLVSIDNQTGQYEFILDSLDRFLPNSKKDGIYLSQIIPFKKDVLVLQNSFALNLIYIPFMGYEVFFGTKGVHASKIWKTDGSKKETQEFIDIKLDTSKNLSSRIFVSHDRLYFGGVLKDENSFSIYDITDGQLNKVFTYDNLDYNSLLDIGLYYKPYEELYKDYISIPISLENKKDYFPLYHHAGLDLISIDSLGNFTTEYKNFTSAVPYEDNGQTFYWPSIYDIKHYGNKIYLMSDGSNVRYKIQEFNDETKELRLIGSEFRDSTINFGYEPFLKTDDGLYFVNKKVNEAGNSGLWRISSCKNDHSPVVNSQDLGNNTFRYTITNSISDSYTWLVENATIINKGYDFIDLKWDSTDNDNIMVYGVQNNTDGICMSKTTVINGKVTSIKSKENRLQMSLFPNPANSKINIQFPEYCEGNLRLLSINGSNIKTLSVRGKDALVDVNDLPSGTYILLFEGNKNIQSLKLSVVK